MAEQFSPTGLWAHYENGDTWSTPVVKFGPEPDSSSSKEYAWVCHDEGYLVRADTADFLGTFWIITHYPITEGGE